MKQHRRSKGEGSATHKYPVQDFKSLNFYKISRFQKMRNCIKILRVLTVVLNIASNLELTIIGS